MPIIDKKLIEQELKNLPEKGNRVVWDDAVKGFGICITAAGNASFILNYYFDGRQRRFTIGRYPFEWDVKNARTEAGVLRRRIDGDADNPPFDPLAEREQQQSKDAETKLKERTVAELGKEYLERYAIPPQKRPKSIHEDKRMINGIIQVHLGNIAVGEPFDDLHRRLELFRNDLKSTPVQANRALALLSKMFNKAVEWKWRTDNPAKGIARYQEQKREDFLDDEQLQKLTAALSSYPDQVAANVLWLALLTGSRKGEVLTARWSDFNLKSGTWTKPNCATKQKKTEHVPLSPQALDVLKRVRATKKKDCPFLFPGEDGKSALTTVKWAWVKICQSAGLGMEYSKIGKRGKPLKRWRPAFPNGKSLRTHDLRHTFASHLVQKNISLETIGSLLGHTKSETTRRYSHLNDRIKREATSSFGTIVANLGAESSEPAKDAS